MHLLLLLRLSPDTPLAARRCRTPRRRHLATHRFRTLLRATLLAAGGGGKAASANVASIAPAAIHAFGRRGAGRRYCRFSGIGRSRLVLPHDVNGSSSSSSNR
jgi:hypothetical protein